MTQSDPRRRLLQLRSPLKPTNRLLPVSSQSETFSLHVRSATACITQGNTIAVRPTRVWQYKSCTVTYRRDLTLLALAGFELAISWSQHSIVMLCRLRQSVIWNISLQKRYIYVDISCKCSKNCFQNILNLNKF